jgi:thiol-disulfide isomerase/thioredoxin
MAKKETKKSGGKGALVIGIIAVLAIIVILFVIGGSKTSYNQEDIDAFAKCITDNGGVMYGTFWCPHCAKVKKMFGESFRYINYVECDPRGENEQSLLCLEKEIKNYATFEFNEDSNSWLVGEPTFEELAVASGCPAPVLREE